MQEQLIAVPGIPDGHHVGLAGLIHHPDVGHESGIEDRITGGHIGDGPVGNPAHLSARGCTRSSR